MKETFFELVAYLKNPVLKRDANKDTSYRFKKFYHILVISIITGALLTPLFVLIEQLGWVDMNDHAIEEMLKTYSFWVIMFLSVVLAPLLEELFFRAPITLFTDPKTFKIAFYTLTIIFGLIHLTNFKTTTNVLLLAPILVAPQTILGGYLGFIRVRFGLGWSMLLHAGYNAFFMLLGYLGNFA